MNFDKAWEAFKRNGQRPLPHKYPTPYANQCAIRISKVLAHFGYFDSKNYQSKKNAVDEGYALRAQELYAWLNKYSKLGAASTHKVSDGLPSGRGLIYLPDCWQRTLPSGKTERGQTGDHFDFFFTTRGGTMRFTQQLGCFFLDWGVSEDLWKWCYAGKMYYWKLS